MINHSVDVSQTNPVRLQIRNIKVPLILTVGRLIPQNGLTYLLEAVAVLSAKKISFRLIIVGEGSDRKVLEKKVRNMNLAKNVKFIGALRNNDIRILLRNVYALVIPIIKEMPDDIDSIAKVLLEAMAMARPVISSKISGFPEIVNESNGILVPPGDSMALSDAIREILLDKKKSIRRGKSARSLIEESFDLEKNTSKQLAILTGKHLIPNPSARC
jgi:glycosyltransferase involved in cell wall biosynthesis